MKVFVVASALLAIVQCGVIHHESADGHTATSYQNFHMEHFHAVPTYIKKEDKHLLEHPIPRGKTSSSVQVHHGHDKHDPGYATASVQSDLGKGHEELGQVQGSSGSHEQEYALAAAAQYQGHENVEALQQHGYEGLQKGYESVGNEYENTAAVSQGEGHEVQQYQVQGEGHETQQYQVQGEGHEAQQYQVQDAEEQQYINVQAHHGLNHYH